MPPLHPAVRTAHLPSLHATTTPSSMNCTLNVPPCHHYTQQYELYTTVPPRHHHTQQYALYTPSLHATTTHRSTNSPSTPPLNTAVRTVHLPSLHATTTHSSTHCTLRVPPCHHYTQQYALYSPSSSVSCVTFWQYVQYLEQHSGLLFVEHHEYCCTAHITVAMRKDAT